MAIHYLGDIKHITCQTAKGYRRSPLSDISYNSGQALTDDYNGHTYNRRHHDGTQIIDTDIVSAEDSCIYADKSISSDKRRRMMYNDLYNLNKRNDERIYWRTEIALSNLLTDEQMKEVSREIALSFSDHFHRPIDYSIHKKPATKKKSANNHIHLASPERSYDNGKWGNKSTSYYIDRNGNPIYDKVYKDASGNDIRKPRTIGNAEPVEAINPETGLKYYVNQRKDAKGRLQWKRTDINALDKDALQWMHNEIDRIQNMVLAKHNIDDKVKRNDKRTTRELQQAGIKAQHIGKRDMEKKGEQYQEKIQLNQQYDYYKKLFDNAYAKLDEAEHALSVAEWDEAATEKQIAAITADKAAAVAERDTLQNETADAVIDYVENELRPDEIFANHSVNEFNKAIDLTRSNIAPLVSTLDRSISAADHDINKLKQQAHRSEKEKLLADFIQKNQQHMERYRNAALTIYNNSYSQEKMRKAALKRWKRNEGWLTHNYIKRMDPEIVFIYHLYLKLKKLVKSDKPDTQRYLTPFKCEHAIQSVIKGRSVPNIKSRIDSTQSATDNAIRITSEKTKECGNNVQAQYHTPPPDTELLTLWATVPKRMIQLTADEKQLAITRPLRDYNPESDADKYQEELTALQKQPPTRDDYDRLADIRNDILNNIRKEAMEYHPDPAYVAKLRADLLLKEYLKLPIKDKDKKAQKYHDAAAAAQECWKQLPDTEKASKKTVLVSDLTPDNRSRASNTSRKK